MPVQKSKTEHNPTSERASSAEIYRNLNRNEEALDCVLQELFVNASKLATNETGKHKPDLTKTAEAMFRSISKLSQALCESLDGRSKTVAESNAALSRVDLEIAHKIDEGDEKLAKTLTNILGARYGMDIWIRDDTTAALDEVKAYIANGQYAFALDCLLVGFTELFNKLSKEMSRPDEDWLRTTTVRQQASVYTAVSILEKRSAALEGSEMVQEQELREFDISSIERIERIAIREKINGLVALLKAKDACECDVAEVRASIGQPREWVISEVLAKAKEIARDADKGTLNSAAELVAKLTGTFTLQKQEVLEYFLNGRIRKNKALKAVSRIPDSP